MEGIAGAAVMVTTAVEEESPADKMRVYNKKSNLIAKVCFVLSSPREKRVSLRKECKKSMRKHHPLNIRDNKENRCKKCPQRKDEG